MLDKKDKEILYQLDLNSRQSFNQIAKKVKLSREVVQYRVKQLEKKGIIKGYQTLIDVSKLGYLNCRFFLKFQRDTLEDETKIIDYFKNHPQFWWVDSPDSYRDLGIACCVKDMYELHDIKEDIVKKFGRYIHKLDIAVYHKFYIYKRKYLSNRKEEIPVKIMFGPDTAQHDDKDIHILKFLTKNARITSVDLSKRTGISITNINYRIKKMISNGIIKDFRVILDLQKIGYYWYKIEMQLEDLSIKKGMLEFFRTHPNIVYAYETVSDNDIEVEMEVKSYEDFRKVLNEIRAQFGKKIKKYQHMLWHKEHKFLFELEFYSKLPLLPVL